MGTLDLWKKPIDLMAKNVYNRIILRKRKEFDYEYSVFPDAEGFLQLSL